MSQITRGLIGTAALITLASVVNAAPIPSATSTSAGVPLGTPSLTGFQTTGNDMSGSQVTVRFADGLPGKTVFDIVNGPTDSPGSANGNVFSSVDGPASFPFAAGA